MIIPTSLAGVLGATTQDLVDLCFHDDCKMIFRARIVGIVNKVPAFFDIRSYKPNAYTSPGVLMTESQQMYLINEYMKRFPS